AIRSAGGHCAPRDRWIELRRNCHVARGGGRHGEITPRPGARGTAPRTGGPMITADCDVIREELDAFVDGELRGADLRRVSDHLDGCRPCTDEVEERRKLGGLIRETVSGSYHTPIPTGLAAGVVARTRAETYFSWRAGLSRAVDD